jgi:hypothetical protein
LEPAAEHGGNLDLRGGLAEHDFRLLTIAGARVDLRSGLPHEETEQRKRRLDERLPILATHPDETAPVAVATATRVTFEDVRDEPRLPILEDQRATGANPLRDVKQP